MKVMLIVITLAYGASWDQARMQSYDMPTLTACMARAKDILASGAVPKDGSLVAAGCAQFMERR
jgi:hypothetical protein